MKTITAADVERKKRRVQNLRNLARNRARDDARPARTQRSSDRSGVDRDRVLGAPHARRGENVMTSRGYSFARAAALAAGQLSPDDCKEEMRWSGKIRKSLDGTGFAPWSGQTITLPLSPAYFLGDKPIMDRSDAVELKSLMEASIGGGFDPDEAEYITRKSGGRWTPDTMRVGGTTQSAVQANLGGALVPFPEMGPLIPLLRNRNALMTAGCRTLPFPPSGKLAFPRQTGPTTGYAIGEGQSITQSNVTTDQLTLMAKKIGAFLTVNNELLRYGGPIVEQMFRNDMTITLGLTLDWFALQAGGSDNVITGLIGYPGTISYTAGVVGASGNTLTPGDVYTIIGQILANNAVMEGWIARPELIMAMYGKRASVLAAGDNLGLFLFDITRGLNARQQTEGYFLGGHEVTMTANAPANRTKGSSSNLTTLYAGWWSDYIIAMYGTIEFAVATQGTPAFQQDQSQIRAILTGDAGPQHPGGFATVDQIALSTIGN